MRDGRHDPDLVDDYWPGSGSVDRFPEADPTPTPSTSAIAVLQQLATEAGNVVEFDARAQDVLAARLGEELARRVVSGDVPPSPRDKRHELAVDAAAMVAVCRELLESRQNQLASDRQASSADAVSRLLLESAGEGFYGVDREGHCTYINTEGLRLLGFGHASQVLGKNMHDLVHHTRGDGSPYPVAQCEIFAAHREGRGVVRDDEVLFRQDGSSFPVEYRSYPIKLDGEVEGSVLTFTDITERRGVEAELAQSRSLQQLAGEVAGLGGWSIDIAQQETTCSEELYGILGRPRHLPASLDDGLGRYLPSDRHRVEEALEQCAATGLAFDLEAQIETYDAHLIWVRVIGWPRYGPDGTVTHVSGAFQDIDRLKASTQAAEEFRERLTRTLESITDAFWTVDGDWKMTYINRCAEQLLRRSRDELLGADLWESFPEAEGSVLDEVFHRVMRLGISESIEEFYWYPLDVWLDIQVYSSEQGLAVYFRDVGDQRKLRLELREREARVAEQASLLDKARDAIVVRDLDHRVTYWNPSAERLFGYSAEEAVGHSVRELIVEDNDLFDQAHAKLLEHGEWVGEARDVAKDGSTVISEAHWTLVRDDDGRPASVLSIKSDVTERRRLEQQVLRTQRIESLGTLAGGIAHDLNNVLAPILLAAQAMQLSRPGQRNADLLSIIEQSADRGADLVRQVLSFARGVEGEQAEVDLAEIVDQMKAILSETFPKDIKLNYEIQADLPPVLGDSTQLHQVLMNMCINARDAMPDGGHLRIGIDVETVTDVAIAHECPPGRYFTVRIEDTGVGMDSQTLERIFEPFFTTKPEGQGTGLGLPTCYGIVRRHGGFIKVSSQLGAGTTFFLHLPVTSGTASPSVAVRAAKLPCGRGQLLLLIEDEDHVRTTARATLEAYGYRVIDAASGEDGLLLFAEHGADIAAVITDMTMPHMDGPTTITHLLTQAPTIPILAISGLTSGRHVERSTALGIRHFLAKPFSCADLVTAVAQLLSTGPATAPSAGSPALSGPQPDPTVSVAM